MKLTLWFVVLLGYFLSAHASLVPVVINPGGIGGIFKGPDSETVVQGPDGSIITAQQEGGLIQREFKPIVAAEQVLLPASPEPSVHSVLPVIATPRAVPVQPVIAGIGGVHAVDEPLSVGKPIEIVEPDPHIIETEIVDAPAIEPKGSTDLIGPSGRISTKGSESIVSGPASTTITKNAKILIAPVKVSAVSVLNPVEIAAVNHVPIVEINNELPQSSPPVVLSSKISPPVYSTSEPPVLQQKVIPLGAISTIAPTFASTLEPPKVSPNSRPIVLNQYDISSSRIPLPYLGNIGNTGQDLAILGVPDKSIEQYSSTVSPQNIPDDVDRNGLGRPVLVNDQLNYQLNNNGYLGGVVPQNQRVPLLHTSNQGVPTLGSNGYNQLISTTGRPVLLTGEEYTSTSAPIGSTSPDILRQRLDFSDQRIYQSGYNAYLEQVNSPNPEVSLLHTSNQGISTVSDNGYNQLISTTGRPVLLSGEEYKSTSVPIGSTSPDILKQRLDFSDQRIYQSGYNGNLEQVNSPNPEVSLLHTSNQGISSVSGNGYNQLISTTERPTLIYKDQYASTLAPPVSSTNHRAVLIGGEEAAGDATGHQPPTQEEWLINRQFAVDPAQIPQRNIVPPEINVPRAPGLLSSNIQRIDKADLQRFAPEAQRTIQNGYYQNEIIVGNTDSKAIPLSDSQTYDLVQPQQYDDNIESSLWNRYGRESRNRKY